MKVIRNINNNVSLCRDENGKEAVVFGKGVGFTKPPLELPGEKIEKIFYGIERCYLDMFERIPMNILAVSSRIVDYANQQLKGSLRENLVLTMADHIMFAIERSKGALDYGLIIEKDVKRLFELEFGIGEKALEWLKTDAGVELPGEEISYIALHIINAEQDKGEQGKRFDDCIIEEIVDIIEKQYSMRIDRDSFNYTRFESHMRYLLKRGEKNELINSENIQLFEAVVATYPKVYECAKEISRYFSEKLEWRLSEEEQLYLMLHINRLCVREDCY